MRFLSLTKLLNALDPRERLQSICLDMQCADRRPQTVRSMILNFAFGLGVFVSCTLVMTLVTVAYIVPVMAQSHIERERNLDGDLASVTQKAEDLATRVTNLESSSITMRTDMAEYRSRLDHYSGEVAGLTTAIEFTGGFLSLALGFLGLVFLLIAGAGSLSLDARRGELRREAEERSRPKPQRAVDLDL